MLLNKQKYIEKNRHEINNLKEKFCKKHIVFYCLLLSPIVKDMKYNNVNLFFTLMCRLHFTRHVLTLLMYFKLQLRLLVKWVHFFLFLLTSFFKRLDLIFYSQLCRRANSSAAKSWEEEKEVFLVTHSPIFSPILSPLGYIFWSYSP